MSYESVEAALATQLETIANLKVVKDDATKIQSGSTKVAILRYSSFEQERFSMGGNHHIRWVITVALFCRYTTDAEVRDSLRELRLAVLNRINQYPRLGDSSEVFDAFVVAGRAVPEAVVFGSYRYFSEEVDVEIIEEIDVSLAE